MSVRRSSRDKKRTPSPVFIYPHDSSRSKKPSLFHNVEQLINTNRDRRRGSSKQDHPKLKDDFQRSKQDFQKSAKQQSKYRIVTEPIQHFTKIQHLVNSNVFGNASFHKISDKPHLEKYPHLSEKKIKPNKDHECPHCANTKLSQSKLLQELEYYKIQVEKISASLAAWRGGSICSDTFGRELLGQQTETVKLKQSGVTILKSLLMELVRDVESLAKIDFIKMLKSEVFVYEGAGCGSITSKVNEAKSLLAQLRSQQHLTICGTTQWTNEELMLRNLHLRFNQLARENLEMKIRGEMTKESSGPSSVTPEYLKMAIDHVIRE